MQSLIVIFLASFLIWFLFLGLFVLWIVDGRIKKEQVLHAIFAMVCVWLITFFIKDFFPSQRPFMINSNVPKTVTTPLDPSFPSSHTAVAFALATTIFLHDRRIGSKFFLGASLVAVGRILANVHYPVDVAFGAFLGILVAWIVGKTHMFGLLSKR